MYASVRSNGPPMYVLPSMHNIMVSYFISCFSISRCTLSSLPHPTAKCYSICWPTTSCATSKTVVFIILCSVSWVVEDLPGRFPGKRLLNCRVWRHHSLKLTVDLSGRWYTPTSSAFGLLLPSTCWKYEVT